MARRLCIVRLSHSADEVQGEEEATSTLLLVLTLNEAIWAAEFTIFVNNAQEPRITRFARNPS
jgi:hypothetical protein